MVSSCVTSYTTHTTFALKEDHYVSLGLSKEKAAYRTNGTAINTSTKQSTDGKALGLEDLNTC